MGAWTRERGGRSTRPRWDSRSRSTLSISWTSPTWSEVTTWRRCSGSPMEKAQQGGGDNAKCQNREMRAEYLEEKGEPGLLKECENGECEREAVSHFCSGSN